MQKGLTLRVGLINYVGGENGEKTNPADFELSVYNRTRTVGNAMEGAHEETFQELAISANIWQESEFDILAGGQMVDELAAYFPKVKRIQRIAELWKQYHLKETPPEIIQEAYRLFQEPFAAGEARYICTKQTRAQRILSEIRTVAEPRGLSESEANDRWKRSAHAWTVTFHRNGRKLTTPFFMGSARPERPELRNVMGSLFLDARLGEESFDEFISELGLPMDTADNRKKARTDYAQCVRIGKKLRTFFGSDFETIQIENERSQGNSYTQPE